jgi:hypothetical protein
MTALTVSLLTFVCCCASAATGVFLHIKLPDHHLDSESKDVMKSVMGIIATMAALVLGLLIASSKNAFDTQSKEIQQLSANVVQLDRVLASYGPETREIRGMFKAGVISAHRMVWPENQSQPANLNPFVIQEETGVFYNSLQNLSPKTEMQRHAQEAALQLLPIIAQTRMLMFEQMRGTISWPLLEVLISWVTMLFLGFGMFARPHATIAVTLMIGALSVASAVFLIVELSQPYQGWMRVSDSSIQFAISHINR